jgi:hypothetical protein
LPYGERLGGPLPLDRKTTSNIVDILERVLDRSVVIRKSARDAAVDLQRSRVRIVVSSIEVRDGHRNCVGSRGVKEPWRRES